MKKKKKNNLNDFNISYMSITIPINEKIIINNNKEEEEREREEIEIEKYEIRNQNNLHSNNNNYNNEENNNQSKLLIQPKSPKFDKKRSVYFQKRSRKIINLLTKENLNNNNNDNNNETSTNNTMSPFSPLSSFSTSNNNSLSSPKNLSTPIHIKNDLFSSSISSKQSNSKKSTTSSTTSSSFSSSLMSPELECLDYMDIPKVPRSITSDWANSRAIRLAMNSDDDDFAAELKILVTNVCEHNPRDPPSKLLQYYPSALKLLLQLHRELKCPRELHKSFWIAHRTPSIANLATVLTRIIQLGESRVLLFDLLKACMGNPSPRLLTRMLEDNKKKQEEKQANVNLFAKINYFGQSSEQIRARARATTAVSCQSDDGSINGYLPNNLDELRELIRGKSLKQSNSTVSVNGNGNNNNNNNNNNNQPSSTTTTNGYIPRNSQILKPSQLLQLNNTQESEEDRRDSGRIKEPKIQLKRFGSSKAPSMDIITEDDESDNDNDEEDEDNEDDDNEDKIEEDEDDDNNSNSNSNEGDERIRQESIRKFVQARFSGRESNSNLSTNSRNPTLVPFSSALSYSFDSNDGDKDDENYNNNNNNNNNNNVNDINDRKIQSRFSSNFSFSSVKSGDNFTNGNQNENKLTRLPSISTSMSPQPPSTPNSIELSPLSPPDNKQQQQQQQQNITTQMRRNRYSKRISMQCVHPKLLEKICFEWMESVPWKIPVFICNQRVIAKLENKIKESVVIKKL